MALVDEAHGRPTQRDMDILDWRRSLVDYFARLRDILVAVVAQELILLDLILERDAFQ